MSVEENKAVMLRFIDAVNKGDRDAAEAVVDLANYKENNPAWGAISFDAAWQTYYMVRAAMPDLTSLPDAPAGRCRYALASRSHRNL